MNIVYVSREYVPSLRGGGIASYVREVAENMAKRGHQVTVIAASDDTRNESDEIVNGVRVVRLSGGDFIIAGCEGNSVLKKFRCLYRFRSYRRKIRDKILSLGDVDIVEVPEFGAEGYYLRDLGCPVTVRLHTPTLLDRDTSRVKSFRLSLFHEYWVGRRELAILPDFKYITSCSDSLKKWFEDYCPKACRNNIEVIYNPIDTDSWITEDNKYQENTIFFAGTVAQAKGVGDLIEACRILREEHGLPVRLDIAGKLGSYAVSLKQYAEQNNFGWCRFLGNQPREKLKDLYAGAKVTCLPSWWENFAIVVMEAMLAGNIVVGSSNGGMAEIITDGVNGYLAAPQDPRGLAVTLRKALGADADTLRHIHTEALKTIGESFTMDNVLARLENYYHKIIRDYAKS